MIGQTNKQTPLHLYNFIYIDTSLGTQCCQGY